MFSRIIMCDIIAKDTCREKKAICFLYFFFVRVHFFPRLSVPLFRIFILGYREKGAALTGKTGRDRRGKVFPFGQSSRRVIAGNLLIPKESWWNIINWDAVNTRNVKIIAGTYNFFLVMKFDVFCGTSKVTSLFLWDFRDLYCELNGAFFALL